MKIKIPRAVVYFSVLITIVFYFRYIRVNSNLAAIDLLTIIILIINIIFYFNQSLERNDYMPLYPDSGMAIFFSITALSGLFYAHRTLTAGLRYPNPLPEYLIIHGLLILMGANILFFISYYSPAGPWIVDKIHLPYIHDSGKEDGLYILRNILMFGVFLYIISLLMVDVPISMITNHSVVRPALSAPIAGPINVLSFNIILTILPLFFLYGLKHYGPSGWPTVASLLILFPMLFSGTLSHIIFPIFALVACYHFYYARLPISAFIIVSSVVSFVLIVGKRFRNVSATTNTTDAFLISVNNFIFNFPHDIIQHVIGRLSTFGSFLTVLYLKKSGEISTMWGLQLFDFWWKLVPSVSPDGRTARFSGGFYTHHIYPGTVPQNHNTALGALGEWYLHFHILGIIIGVIIFGVVFRIWTDLLFQNMNNLVVVSLHATNLYLITRLIPLNSSISRALLIRLSIWFTVIAYINYRSLPSLRRKVAILVSSVLS